jgi:hypothetical protein
MIPTISIPTIMIPTIWMTDPSELRQACLDVAINSENPAVVDAVEALCVLIRLSEPEEFSKSLRANSWPVRVNLAKAHQIVDEVLEKPDNASLIALENFIDVASRRRKKKR